MTPNFRLHLLLSLALAPAAVAFAQPDAERLAALEEATVLVLIPNSDFGPARGSGVLIRTDNEKGYVATTFHNITPALGTGKGVEVVLRSGTEHEQVVNAKIVATYERRDVALLEISAADLPEPVALPREQTARDGDAIYVLGFPLGDAIPGTKAPASLAIRNGTIAGINQRDSGYVYSIEIKGQFDPGQSGGPIVNEVGNFVGLCRVKPGETLNRPALPATEISTLFDGAVADFKFSERRSSEKSVIINVIARINNIGGAIQNTRIQLQPKDSDLDLNKPNAGEEWGPISDFSTSSALQIEGSSASGEITLESDPKEDKPYYAQIEFTDRNGVKHYTEPKVWTIGFSTAGVLTDYSSLGIDPSTEFSDASPRTAPEPDDWLGAQTKRGESAMARIKSEVTGTRFKHTTQSHHDLRLSVADLNFGELADSPQWDPASHIAYVLCTEPEHPERSVLRAISMPDFVEVRRFRFSRQARYLTRCALGLIVVFPERGEFWILDEKDLMPVKGFRFPPNQCHYVAASPFSNVAIAYGGYQYQCKMIAIDLESGSRVRYDLLAAKAAVPDSWHNEDLPTAGGISRLTMFDHGSRMLWYADSQVHVASLFGSEIAYLGAIPEIYDGNFFLTPDENHILAQCGAGSTAEPASKRLAGYYSCSLKMPNGPRERCVPIATIGSLCFGADRKEAIAANDGTGLLRFDSNWIIHKLYGIGMFGYSPLYADEKPGRFLSINNRQLSWLEFDAGEDESESPPAPTSRVPMSGDSITNFRGVNDTGGGKYILNAVWVDGGSKVITLQENGTLRRLSTPDLHEEHSLSLGQHCSWIDQCREGLIVSLDRREEVWLIRADDFSILKKIAVPGVHQAVSSPTLNVAFASMESRMLSSPSASYSQMVSIVDLEQAKIVRQVHVGDIHKVCADTFKRYGDRWGGLGLLAPAVTPDGKYLFGIGDHSVNRLRIKGYDLLLEEGLGRDSISLSSSMIRISPDSKYVQFDDQSVYRTSDFSAPITRTKERPLSLVFDPVAGALYGVMGSELVSFGPDGDVKQKLGFVGAYVEKLFVNPRGREILILPKGPPTYMQLTKP